MTDAKGRNHHFHDTSAIIKHVLPASCSLQPTQGSFGAGEPVSRVFEWVASALRSPTLTFELVRPDRKPLASTAPLGSTARNPQGAAATARRAGGSGVGSNTGSGGGPPVPLTVSEADLVPSVLLNLRPTGQEAAALAARNVPLLSDAMLRTTTAQ